MRATARDGFQGENGKDGDEEGGEEIKELDREEKSRAHAADCTMGLAPGLGSSMKEYGTERV